MVLLKITLTGILLSMLALLGSAILDSDKLLYLSAIIVSVAVLGLIIGLWIAI